VARCRRLSTRRRDAHHNAVLPDLLNLCSQDIDRGPAREESFLFSAAAETPSLGGGTRLSYPISDATEGPMKRIRRMVTNALTISRSSPGPTISDARTEAAGRT
jgi:hypothetical protein